MAAGGLQVGKAGGGGRIAVHGVLGHHGQGQGFGKAQPVGGLVEIDQAGGLDAFDVAAVRCQVQVGLQDAVLVVMARELQSPQDLVQFAGQAARVKAPAQPGHLHGDGGSPHPPAAGDVGGPECPDQGQRIHAGMAVKILVLVKQGGLNQAGLHLLQGAVQSVTVVVGQRQAQQAALAVEKGPGLGVGGFQLRAGAQQVAGGGQSERRRQNKQPALHGAGATVTRPPAVAALRLRSYMDSAAAAGRLKLPAEITFTR